MVKHKSKVSAVSGRTSPIVRAESIVRFHCVLNSIPDVNTMAANLTGQVRAIANVTTAVARGDLSKKITADVEGEILELKNTINIMVDQLNSAALRRLCVAT